MIILDIVTLADYDARIVSEFNSERNQVTPDRINANSKSGRAYWWRCSQGHEWETTVRNRVEYKSKCPYCSGRRATKENNLQSLFPDLAALFNETANGMTASEVTPNFGRKMQWKCDNGHEFLKSPRETVRTKGACRECNSLAYKFPHLKASYHPDNLITFEDISYGSNKKVKWLCESGHEYESTVIHRTADGRGCPYCAGRYATNENNLLLAYPEIAKEFDPEKSGTTADKVTPKSNQQMWWNCSKGHSYKTTPNKKTREDLPYGCPFCSGYQVNETNSFGALFPELAKEFDTALNGVSPDRIPTGRSKVYTWKCEKAGHLFRTSVASRTRRNTGCPYCYGRYPTAQNNLAVVKPDDAKHFHPTKNGKLTAYDFTPNSNKKVYWICEKGHEWITTPAAKQGCAQCSLSATSKIEKLLRESLADAKIMDSVKDKGSKLRINWRNNSTLNIDIMATLGDKKFAIEYDGYYFHSGIDSGNKADDYLKDTQKTQALLDAGYYVVRVREINFSGTLSFLDIRHPQLLQIHHKYSNRLLPGSFNALIKSISEWIDSLA